MELRLSIIEKLQIALYLLVLLSAKVSSELYDVTTIYRLQERSRNVDFMFRTLPLYDELIRSLTYNAIHSEQASIEIHARTNALGLPFLLDSENNTISGPTVDIEFPECYPYIMSGCENWFKINWDNTELPISKIPPLLRFHSPVWTNGNNLTTLRKFNENGIKIIFKPRSIDGTVKIFLLDKQRNYKTSKMYYLQIPNKNYFAPEAHISKCTSYLYSERMYIPGEDFDRYCSVQKTSKNDFLHWNMDKEYTIHVSIMKGTIKVSIEYDKCLYGRCATTIRDLLIWNDRIPIDVMYFATATFKMQGIFILEKDYDFLSLIEKEGSLISPKFTPSSNKLCISVVYYLSPGNENALKLAVRLEDGHEFELENMEKSEEWQINRYIEEVPSNATHRNIKLVLHGRKSADSHVLIQRLGSCNAEREEDILVLPHDYPVKYRKPSYDVAVHHIKSGNPGIRKNCEHGGKFDEDSGECVCPAGFVGEICEKGCGPNSYGADCGGRCSWNEAGCKEMILCRPKLGCHCAPGFTNYHCDSPCVSGNYGPSCGYLCGSCKNTKCNPYTGTCPEGCIPGYRPPMCKETYSYINIPPQVVSGYNWLVIKAKITADNINGIGRPLFYQFQYKESSQSESWFGKEPQFVHINPLSKHYEAQEASLNVTGLEAGRTYKVRLILIDEDGNSFQGYQIPYGTAETLCDVPGAAPADLHATNITATGFIIFWKSEPKSDIWCPVTKFEVQVKEDWRWVSYYNVTDSSALITQLRSGMVYQTIEQVPYSNKTDSSVLVTQLLPGKTYKVRVRGQTSKGFTKFSEALSITTSDEAPSEVVDLTATSLSSNSLLVTWKKPRLTAGNIKHYIISYECIRLLGCLNERCNQSSGQLEVSDTSVKIRKLKGNAVYRIIVFGVSGTNGSLVEIFAVTDQTTPSVSPEMNSITMSNRTNSSLTVHWEPPEKCTHYNGYAMGYYYELMEKNKSDRMVNGNTTLTQTTFNGLRAYTQYMVKVYLLTTKGWNDDYPLNLSVKTLSNAPDMVQNLTVYKRSRRMLGLRWAAPKQTYGPLESFTVSYYLAETSESEAVHKTIKPAPCFAWDNYYCHTLESLQHDTKYIVTVQARNSQIQLDGEAVSISSVTEESAPGHPEFLKLTGRENTSLSLEWGIPKYINGLLRSYIISIEETDSYNVTDCCQYLPVQEIIPKTERSSYPLEISGLRPASTYVVSVSAKTVIIGSSVNITTHTLPPTPVLDEAPVIVVPVQANESFPISIQPSTSYEGLISGYLLLILPLSLEDESNITVPENKIWDKTLQLELQKIIHGDFYLAGEYQQSELEENNEVYAGKGVTEKISGKWGELTDPHLLSGVTYRIGLVLILEYYDTRSIGYIESDDFTVIY